ncbi:MAG: hypothetical protein H7A32_03015, partial [Deltaproteobacteria bacterium]|nr:hypothetical protein [Deltaproteobacteria bacterium]
MTQEKINLQHINFKFYIEENPDIDFENFNPVFQTWIQEKLTDELMIDVADYLHVPSGPGMLLVGFEADYSMDNTQGRWGLRYNRKAVMEGSNQEKLKHCFKQSIEACERLKSNKTFDGKLKFNTQELEFFINDRGVAPNTSKISKIVESELEKFFQKLWEDFELISHEDKRQRLGFNLKTKNFKSLD